MSIYKSPAGERAVKERYLEFLAHWPVSHERLRLSTGAGETHVIASGPAGAPALVLLHGAAFNSATWMGDVAVWAKHFRVYAVDVIGQPGLSAPTRPAYDSDGYASWLDDVLRGLAVERASLVGLSLGGWIALDYAIRRPQRVERLVLLAPAGLGRVRIMHTLKVLFVIVPLLSLGGWGRRKALSMTLGPARGQPSPGAEAVGNFLSLIFAHFRPNMAAPTRFSDAALASLAAPVFLIVGGCDPMIDSKEAKARLERHAPRVSIRFLPDVGHAVIGQTQVILNFLLGGAHA